MARRKSRKVAASNFRGPSRPKAGPSAFQRAGKPGISSYRKVPTQRVQLSAAPRESAQPGGPKASGLAAAYAKRPMGGWRDGRSPSGFEAAMHSYTGNPPANLGSSDIYHGSYDG